MIILDREYLFIDLNSLNLNQKSSFLKLAKDYLSLFVKGYRVKRFLSQINENLDLYLKLNSIDTPEKIDNILMQLEDFSDSFEKVEEELERRGVLFKPLLYIFEQVESANMALQALLASKQAQMLSEE